MVKEQTMKKILLLMGVIMMFFLGGCGRLAMLENSERNNEMEMAVVVEALDQRDFAKIKSRFSQTALEEADDFDQGFAYMDEIFQGKIIRTKILSGGGRSGFGGGERLQMSNVYREIETEEDTYILFINYWQENTAKPEMEGIYSLGLVRESEEIDFKNYNNARPYEPGIFYPGRPGNISDNPLFYDEI